MINFILAGIILIIIGSAILFIRKEKKRGVTCIGCPDADVCAAKRNGAEKCSCGCHTEQ